jgi:hypothetical protein
MSSNNIAEIRWDNFPILNQRPPEMSFEEYKLHLKAQKYLLKQYRTNGIRGTVIDPTPPDLETEESKG